MSLSSNSLFHFTNSKAKLFGILENGIKPSYCWEELFIRDKYLGQAVPLISFCDIPLSQIKEHLAKYGSYGIGFTMEWGIKNGLNPVCYLDEKSQISKEIANMGDLIANNAKKVNLNKITKKEEVLVDTMVSFLSIVCNSKNYQADLVRKGKTYRNYKFYDEREWRYIPDLKEIPVLLIREKFDKQRGNNNIKPLINSTLDFSTKDIKYIMVKDDSEIHLLLQHLHTIKFLGESHRDIEILGTKILTAKQVIEDF